MIINSRRIPFGLGLGLAALASGLAVPAQPGPPAGMSLQRLPDGTRFLLIGNKATRPAPTLFVLQGDLDTVQREPLYTEVARLVAAQGFIGVALDAPGHGEDHRPGEPAELSSWCWRLEQGEDLLGGFLRRFRAVLDHLVAQGITDPARVAACGTSRGGFLAFHLAAAEPRIRCVAGIAPVTDLRALREFNTSTARASAAALALERLAPALAGRPVWITIGNHDQRVDTDRAIAFSRSLVTAAGEARDSVPVELLVHAEPGHRSRVQDHERLAAWLLAQPALQPGPGP